MPYGAYAIIGITPMVRGRHITRRRCLGLRYQLLSLPRGNVNYYCHLPFRNVITTVNIAGWLPPSLFWAIITLDYAAANTVIIEPPHTHYVELIMPTINYRLVGHRDIRHCWSGRHHTPSRHQGSPTRQHTSLLHVTSATEKWKRWHYHCCNGVVVTTINTHTHYWPRRRHAGVGIGLLWSYCTNMVSELLLT